MSGRRGGGRGDSKNKESMEGRVGQKSTPVPDKRKMKSDEVVKRSRDASRWMYLSKTGRHSANTTCSGRISRRRVGNRYD